MIVVTQACLNPEFKPIGFVAVSHHFDTTAAPLRAVKDLMELLKKEAPEGTTHLFNFKFEFQPGLHSFAQADAYNDGNKFRRRGTSLVREAKPLTSQPQDGVSNVDAPLQGSPHHYG